MLVKRVLAMPAMPTKYVVERVDGSYAAFSIAPYRKIRESELRPLGEKAALMAYHAEAVPAHEQRLYGLTICNGKE